MNPITLLKALKEIAPAFRTPNFNDQPCPALAKAEWRLHRKHLPMQLQCGVRLVCDRQRLTIQATNLKQFLQVSCSCAFPDFVAVMSYELLKKLLRAIAKTGVSQIHIAPYQTGLTLSADTFAYDLQPLAVPSNFPVFPTPLRSDEVAFNGGDSLGIPCKIGIYQTTTEPIMIITTGNYYTDLEAAIAAGAIVKKGKNPSKAEVYAAIEAHNASSQPAKKYDWVECDRFDLPEGVYRCDFVPGFHDWLAQAGVGNNKVEGGVHEGYVVYALQRVDTPTAPADEPTGDELLALDAAEDAQQAIAPSKPKRQPKSSGKMAAFTEAVLRGDSDEQLMQLTGWKAQGVKGWKGVVLSRHRAIA